MTGAALDSESYVGTLCRDEIQPQMFLGEARFDGHFAVTLWPRDDAAACLAPGLRLADPRGDTPSFHPVVFVFGLQSETALLLGGRRWPTGFRYDEVAVVIPFVQRSGASNLQLHVPRMYAGDDWATWTGNAFYGFNKVRADLRWFSRTLAVSEPMRGLVVEAAVARTGEWVHSGDAAVSAFGPIGALARLPVAGVREDGSFVVSHWQWDVRGAALRASTAAIGAHAAIARGVPRSAHRFDVAAAFEVRNMRWRLSWPAAE